MNHKTVRRHYPTPKLEEIPEIVNSSLLFTVVRNPLDRFLSAYRDKMETQNQRKKANFRNIVKELNHQVNFSNFVETMLGMPVEKWDQHWAPIHRLCPPCAGFHAVARMETFSDDSQYIIQMAGLSHRRNEKRKSARSTFQ